jgi:predicted nucleotidyltransferase
MNGPFIPKSLQRIVNRYADAFAPESIVLFGSYAKGTNKAGSDMDLLVVTKTDTDFTSYLRRAHQLAADCFPRVDVVFVSSEEVKKATLASNAFLISALDCGIVLYPPN